MRLANDAASSGDEGLDGDLTSKEMEELRKMHNPPVVVRRTLEATYLLLTAARTPARPAPPPWHRVQRMLADTNFLLRMRTYDSAVLRDSPALVAFVAAEYFGGSSSSSAPCLDRSTSEAVEAKGSRIARQRSASATAPLVQRQLARSKTLHATRTEDLLGYEPLVYSRVRRASRACAALFKWSAFCLVVALDPLTPEERAAEQAAAAEEQAADEAAAVEARRAAEQAAAPPTPPPPPAPREAAPLVLPALVPPPPEAGASGQAAPTSDKAASLPSHRAFRPPRPAATVEEEKPPKPAPSQPDRHFEARVPFELGSADFDTGATPVLQTICATYCMRRRLLIELVTSPHRMENDALAAQRCRIVEQWLFANGVPGEAVRVSGDSRVTTDDPGVAVLLCLENDRILRDFFIFVAEGEDPKNVGTKDTVNFSKWLAEEFQCVKH